MTDDNTMTRRDLVIGGTVSAVALVLCSVPFVFYWLIDWFIDQSYLTQFLAAEGHGLSRDQILDFKATRTPRGKNTIFCRFKGSSSYNGQDRVYHGRLSPLARDVIRIVKQSLTIPESLLPDCDSDTLEYRPDSHEYGTFLMVHDRVQHVGWVFVTM